MLINNKLLGYQSSLDKKRPTSIHLDPPKTDFWELSEKKTFRRKNQREKASKCIQIRNWRNCKKTVLQMTSNANSGNHWNIYRSIERSTIKYLDRQRSFRLFFAKLIALNLTN